MISVDSPLVSVIIPAYNQADFLAEAIQSVLDQTYPNFEVIVVNDASPDHTEEVVAQFRDPRVKYIRHEENKGLPATRNTGMRAASGEIIALLDSDDLFHPDKLKVHTRFLAKQPEIGVTYNPRFNLNHSALTIRDLWRPPPAVGLADFVLGFPFSPSDMVLRREWAFRVNLFDESYVSGGEDLDFPCRLALAGCQFASVGRALNYRRYHSGRRKKNLPARLNDYVNALNNVFNHPACPQEVLSLRHTALANYHLELLFLAFAQEETGLGQQYLRRAIQLDPSLLQGAPCRLVNFLLAKSIADDSRNHEEILATIMAQLPSEFRWLARHYEWAAARGYLLRGGRAVIWGRPAAGRAYFQAAAKAGARVDDLFLRLLTAQLINYETEFGQEAARARLQTLARCLADSGAPAAGRWLRGNYLVNDAFRKHRQGDYAEASRNALQAIFQDPAYLFNRGVLAILFRSIGRVVTGKRQKKIATPSALSAIKSSE